jgi:hypothetical protein
MADVRNAKGSVQGPQPRPRPESRAAAAVRRPRRWFVALAAGTAAAAAPALAAGCGPTLAPSAAGGRDAVAPQRYGGGHLGGRATGDTQAGAAFARWVLEQDPQRQYITDAVVRGEQTLGVKVQPTATRADLQRLLAALAQGMARTFPGKSLKVLAFYQSGDKLAEADYSPSSQQVDVRFAR